MIYHKARVQEKKFKEDERRNRSSRRGSATRALPIRNRQYGASYNEDRAPRRSSNRSLRYEDDLPTQRSRSQPLRRSNTRGLPELYELYESPPRRSRDRYDNPAPRRSITRELYEDDRSSRRSDNRRGGGDTLIDLSDLPEATAERIARIIGKSPQRVGRSTPRSDLRVSFERD
ncbi:hypothetical protein ABVK25_010789 [Lepraria finkii]|uniref:Uncharacterized protein n=1 Tax=Lepraria finkii TaxID=1340010 RepID=A0ABR4AVT9_9LECA